MPDTAKPDTAKPDTVKLQTDTNIIKSTLGGLCDLYCRAVLPFWSIDSNGDTDRSYSPWFVAHCDEQKLSSAAINEHWKAWLLEEDWVGPRSRDSGVPGPGFANDNVHGDYYGFFAYLEKQGYVVLNTAGGDDADTVNALHVTLRYPSHPDTEVDEVDQAEVPGEGSDPEPEDDEEDDDRDDDEEDEDDEDDV